MSSANTIEERWYKELERSFICSKERSGASIESFGTPNIIFSVFVSESYFNKINYVQFKKQLRNQAWLVPLPHILSFFSSTS